MSTLPSPPFFQYWANTDVLSVNHFAYSGHFIEKESYNYVALCDWLLSLSVMFFLTFKNCLFIFETERDRAWTGEGQRERGKHSIRSRLQALSCQHRAWHGTSTHELRNHDLSWRQMLNWLSHPGAPQLGSFCLGESHAMVADGVWG